MITEKKFIIVGGAPSKVQDELNKLNAEGTINVIAFNTIGGEDYSEALVHVGPFKEPQV